ncbi:MAG: APC family permease, partial [Clostridiales Family XIII bacterium]|nr:APC family permease [Clostridiales Family XIII bacterium]
DSVGYADVLFTYGGPVLGVLFIIIAIFGQCAIYNMCVTTAARSALILSDEHFGPKILAKLSNKRGTPWVSLLIVLVATTALLGVPGHQLSFSTLVLVDVFFTVIVCALTTISAIILKRRIPSEDVPFKTPGGKPMHSVMAGLVLFFCVATVLLNGTSWFLGGYAVMLLIPVFYALAKWIWKGAAVKDPQLYPINPKSRLGFGDVKNIGFYLMGFGVFGFVSRFFLKWYEADWGPGYWVAAADVTEGSYEADALAEYSDTVLDNGVQLDVAHPLPAGSDGQVYIPGFYDSEYGYGSFFGNWDGMLQTILLMSVCAFAVGIIIYAFGRKVDRKDPIDRMMPSM